MQDSKHLFSPIRLLLLFVAWMVCPITGQAQQLLDLSQVKREHLITNSRNGETGDVSIYLSFPNWFGEKPGYCPVRVRVVPSKGLKFKSDGLLQVRIGSAYYSRGADRPAVVEIPIVSGTNEATGDILGNFFFVTYFGISASLNGRNLVGQQVNVYTLGIAAAGTGKECKNLILISKESSKADIRRLEALAEMAQTGNWFSQEKYLLATNHTAAYCDVRDMPSNWLCLSSLEQVSIGIDDLKRMDAAGLDVINNYVLAGGFLAVNKVNSGLEVAKYLPIDLSRKYIATKKHFRNNKRDTNFQVNSLVPSDFDPPILDLFSNTIWDQFVSASGRTLQSGNRTGSIVGGGRRYPVNLDHEANWIVGSLLDVGKTYIDSQLASPCEFISQFYETLSVSSPQMGGETESVSETATPFFVIHGFGRVYLDNWFRSDHFNTFEEKSKLAGTIQNPLVVDSGNRTSRMSHGVGDDFWDWLIVSVGRTPVIPFLVFVVLFVGGAAPGLMFWSNRHKRRVWLVVLMPLTAAICTVLLFGYGLLKDGLGAVSRVRSLAFIDERGDGLVWSRQSFFAATVSNQGLMIGPETQFSPVTVNSFSELPDCEQYEVDGMQQYRGMLPPRLQTQFCLTHPLRKVAVLERKPEQDSILNGPAIVNSSNFTWNKAVFAGMKNEFFIASDVGPGQKAAWIASTRADAVLELQKQYKSQPLAPPADSPSADQTSLGQYLIDIFSYRRSRTNMVGQITEETTWTGHLGNNLHIPLSDQTVLLPGTYVLFVSDATYLERCLPGVKDQNGLHAIVGRWQMQDCLDLLGGSLR